ncbi:Zinc transporter [Yamadazyma tenuis]|uniref:Zinc/iron permease n=1 Tax=Candida tenuis (strain ATCC 10573 / BCRC 21748 / CBS 615 / JCM 9827 / NBRC 10315 / NRRL Y-1498 / VKM Y-70) TaxID=590646 RepID=G3BDQ5_CANTC|nr:uncharacterized protein CANTEDRAFT_116407 [Yamadazyma tenuis ATCC 10573]XP_006690323.1 uncharacterized protein CANTEDRAFT_116407 [Yamadazyma tenuis ATCC 10573]EGV61108.1 hypothetical protein CANTEDRAFT_116407 [Yamadazyma tenuis ATCC 10573]EGV61109.1 hypothetical protein CANTEDRAFT_116407 [Yamadazyma tenuis ATCC 10573]WEJ94401.1 Zinc transporter [Yamadazyma tenuis]
MVTINQGWLLAIFASLISFAGCLVIYVDDIYKLVLPRTFTKKHPFVLKENYRFLVTSLSFSSGCLLFTGLAALLPHARDYLEDSDIAPDMVVTNLMVGYWIGIVSSLGLNFLLHMMTSQSVVHCSHDGEAGHEHHEHHHGHDDVHSHNHSHGSDNFHAPETTHEHSHSLHTSHSSDSLISSTSVTEDTPLLTSQELPKRFSLLHIFSKDKVVGECKGYSSAEVCVNDSSKLHYCELPTLPDSQSFSNEIHSFNGDEDQEENTGEGVSTDDGSDVHFSKPGTGTNRPVSTHTFVSEHHHHVTTSMSRLLMIGVQTTLALTLHKVPEGFMTYITSAANSELGLQIFVSLTVHNFIEGFTMCLPLFYSFSTPNTGRQVAKLKAIAIAGVLAGLSQPLGSLAGYFWMKGNPFLGQEPGDNESLNYMFGETIAVTSGFITVIGLTMFGSAVAFNNRSVNAVVLWAVVGMSVIGLTSIISAHS